MNLTEIVEKNNVPNVKEEKPEKTYFFRRISDGYIWSCGEETASETYWYLKNQKQKSEYLGVSDGKKYFEVIRETKQRESSVVKQLSDKVKEMEEYMKTKHRFKFDELLDEDDPKVQKVEAIIAKIEEEIVALHDERAKVRTEFVSDAQNAELIEAQKNVHILPPKREYKDHLGRITNPNKPTVA